MVLVGYIEAREAYNKERNPQDHLRWIRARRKDVDVTVTREGSLS